MSVSKRMPTATRLKISGGSLSIPASRMVPPLNPNCQSATLSLGGSIWASSVILFCPEMILKGASNTRRPESHSTFTSAESIAIG